MKKKIKKLTLQERIQICNTYVYGDCKHCPFALKKPYGIICVHAILNVLEREVEIDAKQTDIL